MKIRGILHFGPFFLLTHRMCIFVGLANALQIFGSALVERVSQADDVLAPEAGVQSPKRGAQCRRIRTARLEGNKKDAFFLLLFDPRLGLSRLTNARVFVGKVGYVFSRPPYSLTRSKAVER